MPDYAALRDAGGASDLPGGGKTFAGQADDPFFLDLRVFDLLYGTNLRRPAQDTLAGLQRQHHRAAGPEVGARHQRRRRRQPGDRRVEHHRAQGRRVFSARRRRDAPTTAFVQVSRLGQPAGQRGRRPAQVQGRLQRRSRPTRTTPSQPVVDKVLDPILPSPDRGHLQRPGPGHAPQRPLRDLPHRHLQGVQGPGRQRRPPGRPQLPAAQPGRQEGRRVPARRRCCA